MIEVIKTPVKFGNPDTSALGRVDEQQQDVAEGAERQHKSFDFNA
jgi:hypothetical protein